MCYLRATLGLFSLHPAGRSGRIHRVRHAGRVCIYRMIQKHRIIFFSLSLSGSRERGAHSPRPSPLSSLLSSPPRSARGHVTTIMPILVLLLCPDLPLLLHLLILPRNLLPTFVSCSLPIPSCVVISSVTHYVSANKRNRNKSALLFTDVTASPAKLHTRDVHLEIILSRFRILFKLFCFN